MTNMTILKQLAAAYANTEVTMPTIAVYDRLLADIPPDDLQTVVDQCLAECKFLPTIAEIRERYHALTRKLGQPSASEAWGEVTQQIRAVGYIGTPTFANPVTAQVVKMMGWRDLCLGENMVADRAHFMKMYDQVVERGDQVQKLLPQSVAMAERYIGTSLQPVAKLLPAATEQEPA